MHDKMHLLTVTQITSSGTDTMINAVCILMYSNMSIIRTFEVDSLIIRIKQENCSWGIKTYETVISCRFFNIQKTRLPHRIFLILPFQFLFLLFHFKHIALSKIFSSMLNRSRQSRQSYLILHVQREDIQSSTISYAVSCGYHMKERLMFAKMFLCSY